MKKIFLCHSSKDKDFVRKVANKLTRAKIVYDDFSFNPGEDFRKAIKKGLDQSGLFIFFASKDSLDSIWCKFEMVEAAQRETGGAIAKHIVFSLDNTTTPSDLPKWMRNSKIIAQSIPSLVARDILVEYFELNSDFQRLYIGRDEESDGLSKFVIQNSPKLLILSGLEGIGRRTFLSKSCSNIFNLHLGPFIVLNETSDIDDLYLKLLSETSQLESPEKISTLVKVFSDKSEESQISELQELLSILCKERCVPCILDNGALLNDEGGYKSIYRNLFLRFVDYEEDYYLAILHRRKPGIKDMPFSSQSYYEYIKPLKKEHSALLLQQVLKKSKITIKSEALREIVEYLDGYPPAIYYAADLAKSYGADLLAADKQMLSDFKARKFVSFLEKLALSSDEITLLRYLAAEESLPLYAISVALGWDFSETSQVLRRLIDLSLVVCNDDNYSISRPIHAALTRKYGVFDFTFFNSVKTNLISHFIANNKKNIELSVIDATLHAISRSKDSGEGLDKFSEIIRPSLFVKYSEESYHQKEWGMAISHAERAEMMLPNNISAKIILLKAFSQLEKWESAQKKLLEIRAINSRRALYFEGFLLRRQKKFAEACVAFKAAITAGDHGLPVLRDYADCLWRCNQPEEAFKYINEAYKMDPENVYLLDLIARICIDTKKWDQAKKVIAELERFDLKGAFVHHRKASLLSTLGDYSAALVEADKATLGAAPFEAFAQKAKILISQTQPEAASKVLEQIRVKFPRSRLYIQNGLQCEIYLQLGKWSEAYRLYKQLSDAGLEYRRSIIAGVLNASEKDTTAEKSIVNEIKAEAGKLGAESAKLDFAGLPIPGLRGLADESGG